MTQFTDILIGIDGGGSKTTALIADRDGIILGRGTSGPSNYLVIGAEAAYAALDAAVEAAAGEQPVRPAVLCLGMAGAARPADQAVLRAWTDARYPGVPVVITHDARLSLAAGTPEGWGVAVLCGTGSMVYGEDPHGQVARADGWGYLLGDDGSGYAIGRAALRAVARAADGRGPQTALTEAILEHWSLAQPQDLIGHVYQSTQRADIAALAALTEAVALQGDAVAEAILQDAGRELAVSVEAVARHLKLTGAIPCALTGSVILKGQSVRAAFVAATVERGLALSPLTPVHEPAQGAIRLAKSLLC
ncbi:MAG TPA: BadF/BadG/BcrA/BcrD ATPase family protein [Anaerolineae bacterium]|nr:BadF/BadG/BcrA/BcrD ATPase family protein [Anaerolineae bacterium]HQK15322.1 BadF/BadG/BcrA/BcrD ATPase family protein [Anaerolineae bacterium]